MDFGKLTQETSLFPVTFVFGMIFGLVSLVLYYELCFTNFLGLGAANKRCRVL